MKLKHVTTGFAILIVFISTCSGLLAENPLVVPENQSGHVETLKVWSNLLSLSGFQYSYQDRKGDIGLVGSKVKKIVKDVPEALKEIETFENYRWSSFLLTLASGAALGFGITEEIDGNDKAGVPLILSGSSGLIGAIVLDRIGFSHLKRGATEFNNYLKAKSDTSEWEEEAVVYNSGSKSEQRAYDLSSMGMALPVFVGCMISLLDRPQTKSGSDYIGDDYYGNPIYVPYSNKTEPITVPLGFSIVVAGIVVGPGLGYHYQGKFDRELIGIGTRALCGATAIILYEASGENYDLASPVPSKPEFLIPAGLMVVSAIYDIATVRKSVRMKSESSINTILLLAPKYFAESKALGLGIEMKF